MVFGPGSPTGDACFSHVTPTASGNGLVGFIRGHLSEFNDAAGKKFTNIGRMLDHCLSTSGASVGIPSCRSRGENGSGRPMAFSVGT